MTDILARQRQIVGTAADWAGNDLVLGAGELALERQPDGSVRARVGDGALAFSASPYLETSTAALVYRGTAGPPAPPPAGAVPGDVYTADPGGVVAPGWGEPAAGETIPAGGMLIMASDGTWHIAPGGIDTSGFVTEPELADTTGAAGAGAGMVGFNQGVTGASPTNLLIHIRRGDLILDNFAGVDPSGLTDSTPGIQAAINAALAQGKALVAGAGLYRHNTQLRVKGRNFNPQGLYGFGAFVPGLILVGQGPLNTVFRSFAPGVYGWDFGVDVDVFFTFDGTVALGSAVITGIAAGAIAAMEINAIIAHASLPANTKVVSKTASSITVTNAAIVPAPGTFTFTASYYKAMKNTGIHGCGFDADQSVATPTSHGWLVRSQVHFLADNCSWSGFKGDGVRVYCEDGDLDGPSYVDFNNCDWLNNTRWGLDSTGTAGRNEINFLRVNQCWFQENGTTDAALQPFNATITPGAAVTAGGEPISGAMRWKGQSASFRDGGFTVNKNVSLLILGGTGSAATFVGDNVAFENCIDRAFLNTGCFDAKLSNFHLYSNTAYPTKIGFESLNNPNLALSIYEDWRVRVTPGVTCDAFKNTALGTTASTKGAFFTGKNKIQEFFAAGQNLIVGDWEFPCNELQCELVLSGVGVTLTPSVRGNNAPIAIRYGGSFGETGYYENYAVRPTGHTINTASPLLPNGLHNIYFFDAGNVCGIEASTVATTTRYGQTVKSTEQGKVYVGRILMAAGALVTGAAARFCNPKWNVALGGWHWLDGTNIQRFKATLPATDTDGVAI